MNIVNIFRAIWKKRVMFYFCLWAISSLFLTPIYCFKVEAFYDIDVVSHVLFGVWFGSMTLESFSEEKLRNSFTVCILAFIVWEFIEVSAVIIFPIDTVINIFHETIFNRVQDLVMDITGLVVITLIYISDDTFVNTEHEKKKSMYNSDSL